MYCNVIILIQFIQNIKHILLKIVLLFTYPVEKDHICRQVE